MTLASDGEARLLEAVLAGLKSQPNAVRPRVTLAWAQSVDGSLAVGAGETTRISNARSLLLTHRSRAMHDAILVGVNTVISDDPLLTVRGVPGANPVAVVLDSSLRIPAGARVLTHERAAAIIATLSSADRARGEELSRTGARILRLPADARGSVDLERMLAELALLGIRSVMVEGGATVITRFLEQRLADQVLITIAPRILGGVRAVSSLADLAPESRPALRDVVCVDLDGDLTLHGRLAAAG